MRLGDVAGDGKAQTNATLPAMTSPIHLLETLEDTPLMRLRDTDSLVRDRTDDRIGMLVERREL
jgi:hypothetical protein